MKSTGKYHYSLINKDQSRDSGLALILILLLIAIFKYERLMLISSIVTLIITMIYPLFFRYFASLWFSFAELLGSVVSKLILTLIYIIIVSPIGIFRKMIGKDSLKLKQFKKSSQSVMKNRDHLFTKENLEKPY